MELFQILKRHIGQPALNFQKCYERDQNIRAERPGSYNRAGGRGADKFNSRTFAVICFSRLFVTIYYKKWTDLLRSLLRIFTEWIV